jgi:hypothetical protein
MSLECRRAETERKAEGKGKIAKENEAPPARASKVTSPVVSAIISRQ